MRLLIIFFLLSSSSATLAKENPYAVNKISSELLQNADMVIRQSQVDFSIIATNEATHKVKVVYTILNENAKSFASQYIFYDPQRKVNHFSGAVYDSEGVLIRKLKKGDIYDRSAVSGFSLYEDSRVKIADLSSGRYPYTVAFEYEIRYKYLLFVPHFVVLPQKKVALEKASFSLSFPKSLAPRFKVMNITAAPIKTNNKEIETLNWNFQHMKALQREPYGPSAYEVLPYIMVAPVKFKYDSYSGSMDSWENFGEWIIQLGKGRMNLHENTKLKVQELTSGLSTKKEKVKVLYEYLQNKTRYVSIQLGIGGFQPFEATVVDQTGYGDCKALSNYMVALLKEADIQANYTLIAAGRYAAPIQADFPSNQFNHVIVAVPDENDTIWLECTSQTNAFGYLGSFTSDRYALLISEQGSTLVKTPSYTEEQNTQIRKADVEIDKHGNAKASISTVYSVLQYESDDLYAILNQKDELKKWIIRNISIPSFDLDNFSVSHDKSMLPSAKIDVNLSVNKLGIKSGKRLFITPNLINKNDFVPEINDQRSTDIHISMGWTDVDTIRYHFLDPLYPEFIPEPIRISSAFGSYEASFSINKEGELLYVRKMQLKKGQYASDSYEEFISFYRDIKKADNTRMFFLSET